MLTFTIFPIAFIRKAIRNNLITKDIYITYGKCSNGKLYTTCGSDYNINEVFTC